MLHRLRQVNFIVGDLEQGIGLYDRYLGMPVVRRSRSADGNRALLHSGVRYIRGAVAP